MRRNLRTRLDLLEQKANPSARPKSRIVMIWSDGVTVDGVSMSHEQYQEQHPSGPAPGDYVLKLPWLDMDAI